MALGTFWIPSGCDLVPLTNQRGRGADVGRLRLLGKGQGVADEGLCKTPLSGRVPGVEHTILRLHACMCVCVISTSSKVQLSLMLGMCMNNQLLSFECPLSSSIAYRGSLVPVDMYIMLPIAYIGEKNSGKKSSRQGSIIPGLF
jgi:hypothetical protein